MRLLQEVRPLHEGLRERAEDTTPLERVRYVRDQKRVTSAGISAGIDMSPGSWASYSAWSPREPLSAGWSATRHRRIPRTVEKSGLARRDEHLRLT